MQICAERNHENVGIEGAYTRLNSLVLGIDRFDRRLHEANARFDEIAIKVTNLFGLCTTKHHVQLGKPENEVVAFVDENNVHVRPDLFAKAGRKLQTTESRPEHDDTHLRQANRKGLW